MKLGQGYYQNGMFLYHNLGMGITRNISICAGVMILPAIWGDEIPYWISPKVAFPIKKGFLNLGASFLHMQTSGPGSSLDLLMGNITLGSQNNNVTIGIGPSFYKGLNNEMKMYREPAYSVGFLVSTGKKGKIISECLILDGDLAWLYGGARTQVGSIFLDYGLFTIPSVIEHDNGYIPSILPWLGFSIPIGAR